MDAALRVQVYLGGAGPGEGDGGLEERLLFSGESQDAAVVVRVGVEVQEADAGYGADGVGYAGDLFFIAALAEVRDGLEELSFAL